MDSIPQKRCTRCGVDKPLKYFSKGARFRDRLQPYCRDCMRAYRAERAAESSEHADGRRRQRSLYSPEERYQRQLAYNRKRRKNPEVKVKANERFNMRYQVDPEFREWRKMLSRRHGPKSTQSERRRYHADPLFREQERQKSNEINRRWRQTPRGKANNKAHWRRWRAAKLAAVGGHTAAEWDALCVRYNHCCLACGQRVPLTEDHIVPLVKGGTDDISNIQPLCRPCNSAKGTQTIDYRPTYVVGE